MLAPPFELGAVKLTVVWLFSLLVAATVWGTDGVVLGVATFDAALWLPVPLGLIAAILNV
jgi:hypothetical protein